MIVCLPAPALSPKPAEARRGSSQPSSALDVIGSVSGSGSMTVHPGCLSVAPGVPMPGGLLLWGKGPCHVPASTQKPETRNEGVGLRGVGWRRVGGMLQRECNMAHTVSRQALRPRQRTRTTTACLQVQTCT